MTELWEHVASTALMGTSRRPFAPPTDDTPVGALLGQIDPADPERALLSAAAVLALHRRAGHTLDATDLPLPTPSHLDDLPRVSSRAAKHLATMLVDAKLDVFIPEWLALATKAGQRVPEEYLPTLLHYGTRHQQFIAAITATIGKRGHWLAEQNPDWHYFLHVETDWLLLPQAQRRSMLKRVRMNDPEKARQMLEAAWDSDKAATRADFLKVLDLHLSSADEPFLESVLADKAQSVRTQAIILLSSLPDSRLVAHMTELVKGYVVPTKGKLLSGNKYQMQLTLPDAVTTAMARDGIEEKSDDKTIHLPAYWLAQMVAAVPLAWWTQTWESTPARLIAQASKLEHGTQALVDGWRVAAQRQQNSEWSLALIEAETDIKKISPLLPALAPDQREAVVTRLFKAEGQAFMQHPARALLDACDHEWSPAFTRSIIAKLLGDVQNNYNQNFYYTNQGLSGYMPHFPLVLIDEIIQTVTDAAQKISLYGHEEFLRLLRFRKSMYEEFNR